MLLKSRSAYYKKRKLFNPYAIKEVPFLPLFVFLFLLCTGFACLFSASSGSFSPWTGKQMIFSLLLSPIFLVIISTNINFIKSISYILFTFSIFLLIIVFFVGKKSMGAVRWINFGFFTIQPSEIAKIATVLALARYYDSVKSEEIAKIKHTIIPILILSPIVTLVALQPDLATSIIIVAITAIVLFLVGMPMWRFYAATGTVVVLAPILWSKMKQYQKLRIINFLNPENDPLGSGYNVIQSKIAIGSGGLFGKGFISGTQGQLKFLPEHHTDFVFTMIGEEFGFLGAFVFLLGYSYLIYYGFKVSFKARSVFAKIVSLGCTSILFLHAFINIGMTVALLPVAGIPLPLLSYGGTIMLITIVCFALIVNIDISYNM
jgi:rod shape determining protein RodA